MIAGCPRRNFNIYFQLIKPANVMKAMVAGLLLLCFTQGHSQAPFTAHFDFGRYELTANARQKLDSFLLLYKNNPKKQAFNIDGHCDYIGSNGYNERLSANRSVTVKKYLIDHGVDPDLIARATAHGESQPLNENKTEEERQLNRRVEISVGATITKTPSITLTEKITDTATKAGTNIVLKNINFYGGTPFLLPESSPTVDELLQVMRRNPQLVIEIQGHICCVAYPGDSPYSATGNGLSDER